jgi:hypothetical protein
MVGIKTQSGRRNWVTNINIPYINPKTGEFYTQTERSKLYKRRWRKERKEVYIPARLRVNQFNMEMKRRVFQHYGGKCVKCGFEDIRALELHHENQDGKEHRTQLGINAHGGMSFYRAIELANYPKWEGVVIVCSNCHRIEHTGGWW